MSVRRKMLVCMSGPGVLRQVGQVVELDEQEAEALDKAGYTEPVGSERTASRKPKRNAARRTGKTA